jgi:hypothetical protein
MHVVTEREWQELKAHIAEMELELKAGGKR